MAKKKQELDVPIEQIIKDRAVSIEKTEDSINWLEEEIKYKEAQLKKGILEENISQIYTLASFPLDHKKPRHVLKIEIEMIKKMKANKSKILTVMKELQAKDNQSKEKNAT